MQTNQTSTISGGVKKFPLILEASVIFNQTTEIINFLENNLNVDLTYKEGLIFRHAAQNNNVQLFKYCLDYYENKCFYKSELARYKLLKILKTVQGGCFCKDVEINEIIDEYLLCDDEDSNSDSDLPSLSSLQFPKLEENYA